MDKNGAVFPNLAITRVGGMILSRQVSVEADRPGIISGGPISLETYFRFSSTTSLTFPAVAVDGVTAVAILAADGGTEVEVGVTEVEVGAVAITVVEDIMAEVDIIIPHRVQFPLRPV